MLGVNVLQPQESFGEKFGTSLGQGLQVLAQHKLNDALYKRQVGEGAKFWSSMGLDDKTARSFASAPESIQRSLLDRLEGTSVGAQQGQQMQQQPQQFDQQGQPMQQQMQQQPQQFDQLGQPIQQSMQQPQQQQQGGFKIGPTKEERRHRELIGAKEQAAINKGVHPFIKETQSKAHAAKDSDMRLSRMKELIKTGNLSNPQFASALKTLKKGVWGAGIDLTSLLSKESQEFDKLTQDFTKNVKDIFGSNVTNMDLETFLSTIPNLSQSNEGKWAVINNLELLNKGADLRNKASRALVKQYGNRLPIDFESQVDELIKPQMDAIAEQFKKGISGPVAKTQPLIKDLVGGIGGLAFGNS